MFSHFFRAYHRARSLWHYSLTALALCAATASAQDVLPSPSYSFLHPRDGRTDLDIEALAADLETLEYNHEDLFQPETTDSLYGIIEQVRELKERGGTVSPGTDAVLAGYALGGMSAAAAIDMITLAAIAKAECAKLGMVVTGKIYLGRSSMDGVQWARDAKTGIGLGRGQFDIRTTKFALCRNQDTNDVEGVAINARWVFNVGGASLMMSKPPFDVTPPKQAYVQRFHAEGIRIQMVLQEINGKRIPQSNVVYRNVEDACVDIWLTQEVTGPDIAIPVSQPDAGVFCAGGYCKQNPPGLDATQ